MSTATPYGPIAPVEVDRAAMVHWWDELTFLHWSYPIDVVQRLLPRGLEVEPFEDRAWVGLVPFFLRIGLPGVRPIPWMSQFAETNVRTYVRSADGQNGIWFFSLDAARLCAVVVARATYRIPYFWSRMRLVHEANCLTYECRRRWPGPHGARSDVVIDVGESFTTDALTERDHFLTARWALYSAPRSGLHRARAHHEPWPLYTCRVVHCRDELVQAAGLPPPTGEPLVHYAPSVRVRIGWPHAVEP
jgi:uncharacterized protein YqjF (DUF2071 family)